MTPKKYEENLNNMKKPAYIGSRALFDPNFIPPRFLPRKRLALALEKTVREAIEGEFNVNINVYGLKGTGKNLQVNHYYKWLAFDGAKIWNELLQDRSNLGKNVEIGKNHELHQLKPYHLLKLECNRKNDMQIFFGLVELLAESLGYRLTPNQIIHSGIEHLWNLFHHLILKTDIPIIIYMQHAETANAQLLSKLFTYAKESGKIVIITGLNTGARQYHFRNYENVDEKLYFDLYSIHELRMITEDRCIMSFKIPIEEDYKDLVLDYTYQFAQPVPGTCINILKDIYYPILQQNNSLEISDVKRSVQYYFDNISIDLFSLMDFVQNTPFEDQLFLDYLIGYFNKKNVIYIPFSEIQNAFKMASEELGIKTDWNVFYKTLAKFIRNNIILPKKREISPKNKSNNGVYIVPHFIPMPIDEIDELLKYTFGMLDGKS